MGTPFTEVFDEFMEERRKEINNGKPPKESPEDKVIEFTGGSDASSFLSIKAIYIRNRYSNNYRSFYDKRTGSGSYRVNACRTCWSINGRRIRNYEGHRTD